MVLIWRISGLGLAILLLWMPGARAQDSLDINSAVLLPEAAELIISAGDSTSQVRRLYRANLTHSGTASLRPLLPGNPHCHRALTASTPGGTPGERALFAVRAPCPTRYRRADDIRESLVAIDRDTGTEQVIYTANARLILIAVLQSGTARDFIFMQSTRASQRFPHSFDYSARRYRLRIGRQVEGEPGLTMIYSDDRWSATAVGLSLPEGGVAIRVFEREDDPREPRFLTYDPYGQAIEVLSADALLGRFAAAPDTSPRSARAQALIARIASFPAFQMPAAESGSNRRRLPFSPVGPNRTQFHHAPHVTADGVLLAPVSPETGRRLNTRDRVNNLLDDRAIFIEALRGEAHINLYAPSGADGGWSTVHRLDFDPGLAGPEHGGSPVPARQAQPTD